MVALLAGRATLSSCSHAPNRVSKSLNFPPLLEYGPDAASCLPAKVQNAARLRVEGGGDQFGTFVQERIIVIPKQICKD